MFVCACVWVCVYIHTPTSHLYSKKVFTFAYNIYVHICVCERMCECVTWIIHIRATWLIRVCNITQLNVQHDSIICTTRLISLRETTLPPFFLTLHLHIFFKRYGLFMRVTCMTHSHVSHDSFTFRRYSPFLCTLYPRKNPMSGSTSLHCIAIVQQELLRDPCSVWKVRKNIRRFHHHQYFILILCIVHTSKTCTCTCSHTHTHTHTYTYKYNHTRKHTHRHHQFFGRSDSECTILMLSTEKKKMLPVIFFGAFVFCTSAFSPNPAMRTAHVLFICILYIYIYIYI